MTSDTYPIGDAVAFHKSFNFGFGEVTVCLQQLFKMGLYPKSIAKVMELIHTRSEVLTSLLRPLVFNEVSFHEVHGLAR